MLQLKSKRRRRRWKVPTRAWRWCRPDEVGRWICDVPECWACNRRRYRPAGCWRVRWPPRWRGHCEPERVPFSIYRRQCGSWTNCWGWDWLWPRPMAFLRDCKRLLHRAACSRWNWSAKPSSSSSADWRSPAVSGRRRRPSPANNRASHSSQNW